MTAILSHPSPLRPLRRYRGTFLRRQNPCGRKIPAATISIAGSMARPGQTSWATMASNQRTLSCPNRREGIAARIYQESNWTGIQWWSYHRPQWTLATLWGADNLTVEAV